MFPQCRFSRPTAKVTGLRVVTRSDTCQGQELVWARSWCFNRKNQVGFEEMLKLSEFFYFPYGKHSFMGEGAIVTLLSDNQNCSLVCTCSILVALCCPTPPPTSINQLCKYKKTFPECFSWPPPPWF